MKKYFFLLLFFCSTILHAQLGTTYWDRYYGGNEDDWASRIKLSNTGDIYMLGTSMSSTTGNKTQNVCYDPFFTGNSYVDLWLLKIDKAGNILWQEDYGGSGIDLASDITFTSSNKILLVGQTFDSPPFCAKSMSTIGHDYDYWILMLDANGNKLWDQSFGSPRNLLNYGWSGRDRAYRAVELSNGEFVVCGISDSAIGGDKTMANWDRLTDFWAVKFDSLGHKIWDHVYGGFRSDYFSAIVPTEYGGFVLAGTVTGSGGDISEPSRGLPSDFWAIKIDSSGNKIWDKRFGGPSSDDLVDMYRTPDQGYMFFGSTVSPQGGDVSQPPINNRAEGWVLKVDSAGNKVWDRRYGGGSNGSGSFARAIQPDPSGGYLLLLICGDPVGNDVTEPSYGISDYLMIKIDEAGNKIWDKRFGKPNTISQPRSFISLQDGSMVICGGQSGASPFGGGQGDDDMWAVRFKMTDNPTGIAEAADKLTKLLPHPNPSSGLFYTGCTLHQKGSVAVFNAQGEMVKQQEAVYLDETLQVDLSDFPKGIYFIRCWNSTTQQSGLVMKE